MDFMWFFKWLDNRLDYLYNNIGGNYERGFKKNSKNKENHRF